MVHHTFFCDRSVSSFCQNIRFPGNQCPYKSSDQTIEMLRKSLGESCTESIAFPVTSAGQSSGPFGTANPARCRSTEETRKEFSECCAALRTLSWYPALCGEFSGISASQPIVSWKRLRTAEVVQRMPYLMLRLLCAVPLPDHRPWNPSHRLNEKGKSGKSSLQLYIGPYLLVLLFW